MPRMPRSATCSTSPRRAVCISRKSAPGPVRTTADDVKTRTKENISGKVDTVKESLGMATDKVGGATPDAEQVKHQARRAVGVAQDNPLGLAVAGAAIGFLAGMLIPSTRVEDEKIGPMADQVKDQIKETGQEAMERGKEVAQQAAETAKEAGQQQAHEMRESATR